MNSIRLNNKNFDVIRKKLFINNRKITIINKGGLTKLKEANIFSVNHAKNIYGFLAKEIYIAKKEVLFIISGTVEKSNIPEVKQGLVIRILVHHSTKIKF